MPEDVRFGEYTQQAQGGDAGELPPPSIHEPIQPFGAPAIKPTIGDAYRNAAKDIASTLETMLAVCEEARQIGLAKIEALNEAGEAHDAFVQDYALVATKRASTLRDVWKKQLEDLTHQTATVKEAMAAQQPPAATEGEQP